MLKVYWADVLETEDFPSFPLSEYRKEKLNKQKHEMVRRCSLFAEWLLGQALRAEDSQAALPPNIIVDALGKPILCDSPYSFNLSHSAHYAACALADHAVGLDIQILSVYREELVKRFFAPAELTWLAKKENRDAAFTRLWCRKESYLKAIGLGLRKDLSVIDLSGEAPEIGYQGRDYTFSEYQCDELFFCICAPKEHRPDEFKPVKMSPLEGGV